MDVDLTCTCGPWLLVVHPSERVRAHVAAAAPAWLPTVGVATPADVGSRSRGTGDGVLVVALDPGRTSPTSLVSAEQVPAVGAPGRVHVLSISDLQIDEPDPAVDSTLPRRRLTRTSLVRHLRAIGVELPVCPHAAPATALSGAIATGAAGTAGAAGVSGTPRPGHSEGGAA